MQPGGSGPCLLDLNILSLVCPQSQNLPSEALMKTSAPSYQHLLLFSPSSMGAPGARAIGSRPQTPSPCPGKSSCELA